MHIMHCIFEILNIIMFLQNDIKQWIMYSEYCMLSIVSTKGKNSLDCMQFYKIFLLISLVELFIFVLFCFFFIEGQNIWYGSLEFREGSQGNCKHVIALNNSWTSFSKLFFLFSFCYSEVFQNSVLVEKHV